MVVVTRVIDNNLHPIGPEKTSDNFILVSKLLITNDDQSQMNSSYPGFKFIHDYVLPLKAPELISAFTKESKVPFFIQGKKVNHYMRRVDANYWKVLDFEFIAGTPFNLTEFESGKFLAIINQQTANKLFPGADALGQTIIVQNQQFIVSGVVNNVPRTELEAYADIWVPYTTWPTTAYRQQIFGNFRAILYHSDSSRLEDARLEFTNRVKNEFVAEGPDQTIAVSHADNKLEEFARDIFGEDLSYESYVQSLIIMASIISILFMLLPSINMVNLNVSRIMERSSEIGIRKAFGASTNQLVWQFVVENIVLTLIGGLLAFILSELLLNFIESSGMIPYVEFKFNLRILLSSLFLVLVFALVSGVYPAFKMARMDPVIALKGGI